MRLRTVHLSLLLLTALGARAYDPLAVTENATPKPLDIIVKDAARKREIPVLVYLPATPPTWSTWTPSSPSPWPKTAR